jgi:FixJ family two-component response regulator
LGNEVLRHNRSEPGREEVAQAMSGNMIRCEMSESETGAAAPPLIAVVDDDASFLRSVGRLLRSAGYAVASFGSPRQFLSSLGTSSPQCLVLDIHMPEMTGLQLLERLEPLGCCLPVIFVTAFDTPQTREQARRAGAFGFLLKPFANHALVRAIQQAMGRPMDDPPAQGEGWS